MTFPRRGRAALCYATRLRWAVFPCIGKFPAIPKIDGGRGCLDASTDEKQIVEWWQRWPSANVAIATGARSGLLVLDVDPRHNGDEELAELEREHGALPRTITGLTGGGGQHYLFGLPRGVRFRSKLEGTDGIDVQDEGQYIVAPPSIHPETGREYAWDAACRPLETQLAELPAWVLQRAIRYDVVEYGQPADDAAKSFLARAFAHAGWLGKRIDAGRINALCPWADEHTQESGSGGTVIFAPRDGSGAGWFHCSHTSHGPKTLREVLAVLPISALQQANADLCGDVADDAARNNEYEVAERLAIVEDA